MISSLPESESGKMTCCQYYSLLCIRWNRCVTTSDIASVLIIRHMSKNNFVCSSAVTSVSAHCVYDKLMLRALSLDCANVLLNSLYHFHLPLHHRETHYLMSDIKILSSPVFVDLVVCVLGIWCKYCLASDCLKAIYIRSNLRAVQNSCFLYPCLSILTFILLRT